MAKLQRKKPVQNKKKKKREQDADQRPNEAAVKSGSVTAKPKVAGSKSILVKKKKSDNKLIKFVDKGIGFLREVKIELKKVVWPSRKQTVGFTAVVIVMVMIISAFLSIVDYGLAGIIRLILQ